MAFASPFRRRRDGTYAVRLNANVRTVLAAIADQVLPMVDSDDQATTRLFPPAYVEEGRGDEERAYRSLVDGALRGHHHQAFDTLISTATAETVSAAQLDDWLSAINSMRLVIGTRLDVSEGMEPPAPGDPDEPEYAVYELLGVVQASIVDALAAELPDEGTVEGAL